MNTTRLPTGWISSWAQPLCGLVAALSLAGWNGLVGQTGLPVPPGMETRLLHNETNSPWAFNGFAKDPFTEHLYLSVYNQVMKVDAKGKRTVIHTLPTIQSVPKP